MATLDPKRPYAEVWGMGPARYQQDGKYFTRAGHETEGWEDGTPRPEPPAIPHNFAPAMTPPPQKVRNVAAERMAEQAAAQRAAAQIGRLYDRGEQE